MRKPLSFVFVLTAALSISGVSISGVALAQDFDAEGEEAMLNRINALRVEHSLAPLGRLPELDAVARGHSTDMASRGALAHVSETSGTPDDRVRNAGVGASTVAENVALHRDTASAHAALLESAPHRANILNPDVTHVGLGSVRTPQGVYVTQLFAEVATPVEEIAPAPVEAPALAEEPSIFQIIPPFLEQQVEQVLGAAAPEAQALPADAPVAPEAAAPVDAAPTSAAPTAAAPTPAPAVTAPTGALRQIIGLAQALLGAR